MGNVLHEVPGRHFDELFSFFDKDVISIPLRIGRKAGPGKVKFCVMLLVEPPPLILLCFQIFIPQAKTVERECAFEDTKADDRHGREHNSKNEKHLYKNIGGGEKTVPIENNSGKQQEKAYTRQQQRE